ncbi:hypothetical protein LIER_09549 [Lithospermum erythrorhizon]|uniref:Retrotransposon gag domain-containing protein n=1 Tax=Lithospermum erythrorhizon TaxID=34254 RepID=A0AAV3PG55_LITER
MQWQVNEDLNREQERTVQSSRYTHHTGHGGSSESSKAPRENHIQHEGRAPTPAVPSQVPTPQVDLATQKLQQELADIEEMMKTFLPTVMSKKECKTNISFTDRLDGVPLPKGFTLPQFTQLNGVEDPIKRVLGFLAKMTITSNDPDIYAKAFSNILADRALDWYMALQLRSIDSYLQIGDAFIAKFGSTIQAHQDERAIMDIQQDSDESLRSYHKWYNDILLTIPEVNNKIAYMAFYRGLAYGKLKNALILETPLSKDELTARVRQYVELEELKNKEVQNEYLRDVIRKRG